MQESAQAALSWVRSHTERARASPEDWFEDHDLHIHVPAGAVPKDGPSAGVTIATAIASLVRGEPVAGRRRHDRRDHAHRPGAADRRHAREVARGAAGRAQARDPPARERAATSTSCRPRHAPRSSSSPPTRSRTSSPPRSTAKRRAAPTGGSGDRAPGGYAGRKLVSRSAQNASLDDVRSGRAAGTRFPDQDERVLGRRGRRPSRRSCVTGRRRRSPSSHRTASRWSPGRSPSCGARAHRRPGRRARRGTAGRAGRSPPARAPSRARRQHPVAVRWTCQPAGARKLKPLPLTS